MSAVGAASEPMLFGLGAIGLLWLMAGLLALAVGLVLATRRIRRSGADGAAAPASTTENPVAGLRLRQSSAISQTTTNHDPGGARK